MSNLGQYIPTNSLANITARGQDRLDAAKATLKKQQGDNELVKGIEGGLGGLKVTTFGKDIAGVLQKRAGAYLKKKGEEAVLKAKQMVQQRVEQAQQGFRDAASRAAGGEGAPIQMGEIGEVEEAEPATEAVAAVAPEAEGVASTTASTVASGTTVAGESVAETSFGAPAAAATVAETGPGELFPTGFLGAGEAAPASVAADYTDFRVASSALTAPQDDSLIPEGLAESTGTGIGTAAAPEAAAAVAAAPEAEAAAASTEAAVDEAPALPEIASSLSSVGQFAKPAVDYEANSVGTTAQVATEGELGGVASTVGEEAAVETAGGILDETGILAPLGLIVGAVGIGLAARKKKNPPMLHAPIPATAGGYSYQVGISSG